MGHSFISIFNKIIKKIKTNIQTKKINKKLLVLTCKRIISPE